MEHTDVEALSCNRAASWSESDRRGPTGTSLNPEALPLVIHELRNPLSAIRFAVKILRDWGDDPNRRGSAIGLLDRQTAHLCRLLDELDEFSCLENDRFHLSSEAVQFDELVQVAVEAVRPAIEERQLKLEVTISEDPMPLRADPMWMVQVISNLLANAAKYTDSGGRISLTVEPDGDEVVVRVRDTGIGIPAESLSRVFDLFWQGNVSEGRSRGGSGIGLALVQRIVSLHGGTVEVFSAGPGQGSEFVVRLPQEGCSGVATGTRCATIGARYGT